VKTVLTIAGSDCSGGAGIQADIKTITAHKLYAMSAITALTAQNTIGVYDIVEISPEFLEKQLSCIFTDIVPDAVKIGMVSNATLIEVIADCLKRYSAKNVVLDPVMISTSGNHLLKKDATAVLTGKLFPCAYLITPNIPEASELVGIPIESEAQMEEAANILARQYQCAVLIKGGHQRQMANDLLYQDDKCRWYLGERIENPNTHGTGCTLSSAIAANLAMGHDMGESILRAKRYLSGAIKAGLNLGNGDGPLEHTYGLSIEKDTYL
jgi:hydroxymethylpyrimidine/phosphomethylpyrimidine kinase